MSDVFWTGMFAVLSAGVGGVIAVALERARQKHASTLRDDDNERTRRATLRDIYSAFLDQLDKTYRAAIDAAQQTQPAPNEAPLEELSRLARVLQISASHEVQAATDDAFDAAVDFMLKVGTPGYEEARVSTAQARQAVLAAMRHDLEVAD